MNLKVENGVLIGYTKQLGICENEITEINIPETVTRISDYTFMGWKYLQSVKFPSHLKSIDYDAFEDCTALEKITFPESLEHIGHGAFWGCRTLKQVYIPEQVNHIGYGTFAKCDALEEISVSENNPYFTSVGGVLYNKNLTELYCCPAGKKEIQIPETVTTIRKFAFCGCKQLTEVQIPESVTKIQYGAFRWCQNLKEILIPVTVLQCDNPDFPPDTLVHVQGKSGVMTFQPAESHGETACILILERDYSILLEKKIKYDFIIRMLFAGIFGAEDYCKKHFAKIFRFLIDREEIETIQKILQMQKFISKRNIDRFIKYAEENSHSTCWEILSNYKKELLS